MTEAQHNLADNNIISFDPNQLRLIQTVLEILSGASVEPLEITNENVESIASTIQTITVFQTG